MCFYLKGLKVRRHLLTIMERSPLFAIIARARGSSAFSPLCAAGGFQRPNFSLASPLLVSDPGGNGGTSVPDSCLRNFLQRLRRGRGSAVAGSGFGDLTKNNCRPKERKEKRQRFFQSPSMLGSPDNS